MKREPCPITPITPDDNGQYFVGYYDKQPWDAAGQRVLAHRASFIDRAPNADDRADVGWIDLPTGQFVPIAPSAAWNWQQGAQLQWYGAAAAQRLLYNDRRDGRLVSVIADQHGEHRVLDHPVYTASADGQTALSLNYARLYETRPDYGYAGLADPHRNTLVPDDDGVFRIDMASGKCELIVSTAQLAAHQPNVMGDGAKHWVNHLMFNPSGTRCCFVHRFVRPDGITHSRLFTCSVDGGDLRLLIEGMVSHYHWRDDTTILSWAGRRKLLGTGSGGRGNPLVTLARRALKPIYYALGKPRILMQKVVGDCYHLLDDREGAQPQPLAKGELLTDGHCTWSADRKWILTDGYPDGRNRQPLYLWDVEAGCGYEVGRYPTPRELDGPTRVDLHPRFSADGHSVCIDSAMDGRRRIYVVDVSTVTGR